MLFIIFAAAIAIRHDFSAPCFDTLLFATLSPPFAAAAAIADVSPRRRYAADALRMPMFAMRALPLVADAFFSDYAAIFDAAADVAAFIHAGATSRFRVTHYCLRQCFVFTCCLLLP